MSGGRFSSYLGDMENFEEKTCLCALGKIFGFKPKIAIALITHFGSACEVFRTDRKELEAILGNNTMYRDIIRKSAAYDAAEELERLEKLGIYFCGWTQEHYPSMLKECPDAPVGLYIRSDTHVSELWKPERRIAVVGTRDVTSYGKEWCTKTVYGLASASEKPMIVSGLALGTDICAHKAAVEAGLPTIAVMATGPDDVYPYRHRDFAEMLRHTPGCALVTDYPPGTAPLAVHFLRRNRIIAGLSDTTVLIESKIKGGGMMTARLAFSYDRDVYALPGRVDDTRSQGCNWLIQSKIAEPLISIPSFLEGIGMKGGRAEQTVSDMELLSATYKGRANSDSITGMAAMLIEIRKNRGIPIEDLAAATGMEYSRTSTLARMLEIDDIISIDLFQRCSINVKKNR